MGWPLVSDYAPAPLLFSTSDNLEVAGHYFNPDIASSSLLHHHRPPDPPYHQPFGHFSTGACRLGSSSSAPLYANPARKRSRDDFSSAHDTRDRGVNASSSSSGFMPRKPALQAIWKPLVDQHLSSSSTRSVNGGAQAWLHEEKGGAHFTAMPELADPAEDDQRGRKRLATTATSDANVVTDTTASAPLTCSTSYGTSTPPLSLSGSPSTRSILEEPQVDDLTQLLGISWQRMSPDDTEIGAAVRGWQKFINNRWSRHIRNSRILLKHRGLNAYLVASETPSASSSSSSSATPPTDSTSDTAFYLFNEDLSEARLVANDWETCVQRLRTAPITFDEGSQTFTATDDYKQSQVVKMGDGDGLVDAGVVGNCAKGCVWEDRGMMGAMDLD